MSYFCYIFFPYQYSNSKKSLLSRFVRIDIINHQNLGFMRYSLTLLFTLFFLIANSQCDLNIKLNASELIGQMDVVLIDDCDSNSSWYSHMELYQCGSGTLILLIYTRYSIYKFRCPDRDAYDEWCTSPDQNSYYHNEVKGVQDWSFVKLSRCRHISKGGRHCSNVVELIRGRCKQHKR